MSHSFRKQELLTRGYQLSHRYVRIHYNPDYGKLTNAEFGNLAFKKTVSRVEFLFLKRYAGIKFINYVKLLPE